LYWKASAINRDNVASEYSSHHLDDVGAAEVTPVAAASFKGSIASFEMWEGR
jgi:hypothetical protein